MLACGDSGPVWVIAGKQKADVYPSAQLRHVSFVATFDVTPAVFM